jgi:hypothetical protein
MIGQVRLILIEAAGFSGIWHIRRVNVEYGFRRIPVLDACNTVYAVYLYLAKTLMPKTEEL